MATILVVDDDRDSRELLTTLLAYRGYDIVEAANGHEALSRLEQVSTLCLILLDLMMPVMNGWDFRAAQRRHERHGQVPVVVLTADSRMTGRGTELSAVALMTKPLDFDALLRHVERHCGRGSS